MAARQRSRQSANPKQSQRVSAEQGQETTAGGVQNPPLRLAELMSFSRRDACTIGWLLCLAFVAFSVYYAIQDHKHGGLVRPDAELAQAYRPRIDLNRCAWPELCLLPGISETLARRIVEHRESAGDFTRVGQLRRIKGIGPLSVKRLAPWVYIDAGGERGATGMLDSNTVTNSEAVPSEDSPIIRSLE